MNKKDVQFGRVNEFLKTFNPPNTPIWPPGSTKGSDNAAHPPSTTGGSTLVQNIGKGFPRHSLPDMEEISILPNGCPFCPIVRKTPWYLHDNIHDIVVCQDLNPRDYKLRILVVGSGTRWHESWDSLPQVHRDLFVALAEAFAVYAITKGQAKELVLLENIHSLFPGHAHIQACLI